MRTWRLGVAVLLLGLSTAPLPAADDLSEAKTYEPVSEGKPAPKARRADLAEGKPRFVEAIDYLDFVFAASDRPVLLRLHLRHNGRTYSAAWDDYMKKLHAYLDKNGDGTLDKTEVERAPTIQFLQFHLQGAIGFNDQGSKGQMGQFDANKDGKVSLAELQAFYRRGGFAPLQFSSNSNRDATDTVTKTIYKRLDGNKDSKLSAAEMMRAPAALQRFDLDENEMLTAEELKPGGEDSTRNFFGGGFDSTSGSLPPDMGLVEIKPGAVEGTARQVLAHYDKDKNGKLSQREVGLDKPLFDRLDANRDGQLDEKEFAAFFRRDADLELMCRIGKLNAEIANFLRKIGLPSQPVRTEIFNPSKRAMPLAAKARRSGSSALAFSFGDAHIGLSAADQQFSQFPRRFYEQQFRGADIGKKGVVDRKQATADFGLNSIFNLADRDGDDKLTEKELKAYLDMQTEGADCRIQLTITDEGRGLFELLDENIDGSLSLRELRTGWTRMKPLAKSDSGLSRQDIPRRLDVSVGQAQRRIRNLPGRPGGMAVAGQSKTAPMWFQKMDRNQDGDVSPREFIGSDEDFRKLDADSDGLISGAEARQFDAKMKKKS